MPLRPDVDSLRLLVAVAELGSIGAAARDARLSQPTASTRIASLERNLGVTLLVRSPTGSRLTEAGRLVAEWASAVLRSMDELARGVEALQRGAHSHLEVASSQTVSEFLMPRWLSTLRAEQPDAKVRLRVANSAQVIEQLRNSEVDIGFIETPTAPRDLRSAVVSHDELVLVGASGDPARQPLGAADMKRLRLITREVGSGTRDTLERAIGRLDQETVERSSNSEVKLAVMAGAGYAVLSRLAVGAEIADGRLVQLPLEGVDLRRPLRALVRRDAAPDRLRDQLLQIARNTPRSGSAPSATRSPTPDERSRSHGG